MGCCICFSGVNSHWPQLPSEKVVLITGANTGLGFISAKEIAKLGATVVLACRSQQRGENAIKELKDQNINNVELMLLDLGSLDSVRSFCKEFKSKYQRLDILMNNAGIMAPQQRETTKDGFEVQFGTNHLGHFLLTILLLDIIKSTPKSRIVNLSSLAHEQGKMNFDDLNWEKSYKPWPSYQASKYANVLFTIQLQQILKEQNADVKTVSLHPGVVRTELGRHMAKNNCIKCCLTMCYPCMLCCTKTPQSGTQTQLYCALIDYENLEDGAYYSDCKTKPATLKGDYKAEAKRLWDLSEEMVKEKLQ